jgi:hypothetical protein
MTYDYIVYSARGGITSGIRLPSAVWNTLRANTEKFGAPATDGRYDTLGARAFAKAAVRALADQAATGQPAGPRWSRLPANVPLPDASSSLTEGPNFGLVMAALALFASEPGVVVERATATHHRANVVR